MISSHAVKQTILLNGGTIKLVHLMKIFGVKKGLTARQKIFKKIVMELCTLEKDADGNKLVLKKLYRDSSDDSNNNTLSEEALQACEYLHQLKTYEKY